MGPHNDHTPFLVSGGYLTSNNNPFIVVLSPPPPLLFRSQSQAHLKGWGDERAGEAGAQPRRSAGGRQRAWPADYEVARSVAQTTHSRNQKKDRTLNFLV